MEPARRNLPRTEPPVRAPAAAVEADHLLLRDGDARWTAAANDVLFIAEPAGDLTPIPHAPRSVRGLACIEGRPFAVVGSAPVRTSGGSMVVVASGGGGIALHVGAVSRGTDPAQPLADALADLAPWAPPAAGRPSLPPSAPAAAPGAAQVPLLLVTCGGVTAALPVMTVERVGQVGSRQPLRAGGMDALVRVEDMLLPARRLADALPTVPAGDGQERWAVVLRGNAHCAALLVDGVVGLALCDPDHIAEVALPDGASQVWLNRPDAEPVPVVDVAALFGWPAASPLRPPSGGRAATAGVGPDAVLTVQADDIGLALPLAVVGHVLDPGVPLAARRTPGAVPAFDLAVALGRRSRPRRGTLVRITPEGGAPLLLSVDRVLAMSEPPAPWQPVDPLPPVAALAFDAVCRTEGAHGSGGHWLYRLRRRLPSLLPALPSAVRRSLAAARLGWVAPETPA